MWEGLAWSPRGRISVRNLILLLATSVVVLFTYFFAFPTTANAADAFWQDGSIVYRDNTYQKQTVTQGDGLNLPKDSEYYLYTESVPNSDTRKAFIIYFSSGTSPPQAVEAQHQSYNFVDGKFSADGTSAVTISIQPSEDERSGETLKSGELNSCAVEGGLGWVICPMTRWIAKTMDYVYGVVSEFLKVKPLQTTQTGSLYAAWDVARNIANICFIISFLIIIYAQVTGGLLTNYTLKKLLPRAVVAAVLINISYWICAVGIDISNILGYSVQDLFENIRNSIAAIPMDPVQWSSITEMILANGAVAVGTGIAAYSIFASTGIVGSLFLLLPVLAGAVLAVLVAVIVLAMRQALIVILVILAPLAFVAYLLPNTEKWFDRWRGTFLTMLFMFPIFSVIFGGSQLAGTVIIQNASSPAVAILGLAVQVAPLVLTPMIIKLSGSLIGRIAGMLNNPNKGILDRTKKLANEHADFHRARVRANAAKRFDKDGKIKRHRDRFRPTSLAYRHERNKMRREDITKARQERVQQMIHDDEKYQHMARDSYSPFDRGEHFGKKAEHLDTYKRDTDALHKRTEASHDKHWNELLDPTSKHFDAERYALRVDTHRLEKGGKAAAESLDASLRELDAGVNSVDISKLKSVKGDADKQKILAALTKAASESQEFDRRIVIEGERKKSAEIKIQGDIAEAFKDNTLDIRGVKIRDYAGGISGTAGANRVYAKAKADIVSAYMEDVKNSRSVLSEYTIEQLINLHQGHRDKHGSDVSSNKALIDAAMQEIVLSKGNNWSMQKTIDYIANRGMKYDANTDTYTDKNGVVLGADEVDRRRDEQQLLVDAYKQGKLKVASLSGTDRGNLEAGTFTMSSTERIIRDIRDKKISAERIAGTDIDELMRMVQILRDSGERNKLNAEQRTALMQAIAVAQTDDRIKTMSSDREKEMMTIISEYLDPSDEGSKDYEAIENTTQTPIPTGYTTDHFYKPAAKFIGAEGEPYGPNGSTTKRT